MRRCAGDGVRGECAHRRERDEHPDHEGADQGDERGDGGGGEATGPQPGGVEHRAAV